MRNKGKLWLALLAMLCLAATADASHSSHSHGGTATLDGVYISGYHTHTGWIDVTLGNKYSETKTIRNWKVTAYSRRGLIGSSTFLSAGNVRIAGHGTKVAKIRWKNQKIDSIVLTDDEGNELTLRV